MSDTPSRIDVRPVGQGDLDAIGRIDRELSGTERTPSWPSDVEVHWWVNRPTLNFVADMDGAVVGFLLGDIRGAEYGTDVAGWIDVVGVLPDCQGIGVGRKLVQAFRQECQRQGMGARVVIMEDDRRLVGFWTALGFDKGKSVIYEG